VYGPRSITDQFGIIPISDEYFEARTPRNPEISWKTGFTLTEVNANHPFYRLDKDKKRLDKKILNQIRHGEDLILLGLPGSGKSTILKQVSVLWNDKELGDVFYRNSSIPAPFETEEDLFNLLKSGSGHVLVVVEDALREGNEDIFELVQRFKDSTDISFLLDSRINDWEGYESSIKKEEPRANPSSLTSLVLPEISEEEIGSAINHYEKLTGESFGVAPEFLKARLESGSDIGRVLILSYYLTLFARELKPEVQHSNISILHNSIRSKIDDIRELGELELKISTLVSILNVAGLPQRPELLHSI
jgi:energy-coupling factor transporter ATP-binding protein EcfA2